MDTVVFCGVRAFEFRFRVYVFGFWGLWGLLEGLGLLSFGIWGLGRSVLGSRA